MTSDRNLQVQGQLDVCQERWHTERPRFGHGHRSLVDHHLCRLRPLFLLRAHLNSGRRVQSRKRSRGEFPMKILPFVLLSCIASSPSHACYGLSDWVLLSFLLLTPFEFSLCVVIGINDWDQKVKRDIKVKEHHGLYRFSSVQSLDRLGCRGDMRDDSIRTGGKKKYSSFLFVFFSIGMEKKELVFRSIYGLGFKNRRLKVAKTRS